MLITLLLFFGLLLVVGLSVRERARQQLLRATRSSSDMRPSPLSNAIAYIVGMAGGIYLSLSLLIDFIGADIPNRIAIWKLNVEPVATLAIGLAVIQPFFIRVFAFFRRGAGGLN